MPLPMLQKEKYLSSNALLPAADLSEQMRPFTGNNHKKSNYFNYIHDGPCYN
jgi:hypothetical protein